VSDWLLAAALWLDLVTARKMVLISLCQNADNETGECFPNQDYIARRSSLSERAVRDHLHALEDDGYIKTLSVGHGMGSRTDRVVNVARIEAEGRANHDAFQSQRKGRKPADFAGLFAEGNRQMTTGKPADDAEKPEAHVGRSINSDLSGDLSLPLSKGSASVSAVQVAALKEKYLGINVDRELEKFNDYRAARGRTYKDLNAAFRMWVGREADGTSQHRGQPAVPPRFGVGRPQPVRRDRAAEARARLGAAR
jgi:hypothetical protein